MYAVNVRHFTVNDSDCQSGDDRTTGFSLSMPCLPSKKQKVIEPHETVQYKNVHRYGETSIRHVDYRRNVKTRGRDTNSAVTNGSDGEKPRRYHARPPSRYDMEDHLPPYHAPPPPRTLSTQASKPRRSQTLEGTVTSDFFVSVPIFTESLDHSYRKKNIFVYRDSSPDSDSVIRKTLSRQSRARSAHDSKGNGRPSTSRGHRGREESDQRRPRSLTRLPSDRRYPRTESVASCDSRSTTTSYSYETETFDPQKKLHRAPPSVGFSIDSDEEDLR